MVAESAQYIERLARALPAALEPLFDSLEDVVFFTKDVEGRYRSVNETLVRRVGATSREALLGRRADEVFGGELGLAYRAQDERVMRRGRAMHARLELHLYPGREEGWCRTHKWPLWEGGEIVGLVGISQDLHLPASDRAPAGVARALTHIDANLEDALRIPDLAQVAGMAPRSFERAVQRLFGLSAGELVIKARMDAACRRLAETEHAIGRIALECGYADHSAFTRQFRARAGITPRAFRAQASRLG